MSSKKKTAVEWLLEEWPILESQIPPRIIDQAKEMEKQQIIDAYEIGFDEGLQIITKYDTAQDYYTSTYE